MTEHAPPRGGFLGGMSPRLRSILVLGVVLAVMMLAFMLLSAGSGDEFEAFPTSTATPRPRVTPTQSFSPDPAPQTDESFEGKDPFEPLVVVPTDGGTGSDPGTEPGPTPTSTTGTNDGGESVRVTLEDVFDQDGTRFATVSVDGDQFTVSEGDTFASNFRLLDLRADCGTFVFGDERFTLCLGQEVRK